MTDKIRIRKSTPGDWPAIESLYPEAFPEEDLLPLVEELLHLPSATWSFAGTIDDVLVAHLIFTKCGVAESSGTDALLGPLAVAPAWQRQGGGTALVRAGLERLEHAGVSQVYVLGNPAYYRSLGFRTETGVTPPYELPAKWASAWQSQKLVSVAAPHSGKLLLPEPWLQPGWWLP